jgi:hypothetical protein
MRKKPILLSAIVFYSLAFISICVCLTLAGYYEAGSAGGATGMGVVAASFILCGSFFLYKHLTDRNV